MAEQDLIDLVQSGLAGLGVTEQVEAAGQFAPRGHTGSMFAGGLIGEDIGSGFGGVGDSIGLVGGALAGARIHDASSGLPSNMLLGVTASHVFGFAAHGRREVGGLVFAVGRDAVTAKVHQRVNVRILELVDSASGSSIQLEGNRIPVTHSKDVIDALT